MKRNRKYCKYNRPRGRKTSYCDFLGDGLQCYKVCNMYVETRDNAALNIPVVSCRYIDNSERTPNKAGDYPIIDSAGYDFIYYFDGEKWDYNTQQGYRDVARWLERNNGS